MLLLAGQARPVFPFTAIVGQDEMKLALILNVIDPKIGGVMIMGDRGTGKVRRRCNACLPASMHEAAQPTWYFAPCTMLGMQCRTATYVKRQTYHGIYAVPLLLACLSSLLCLQSTTIRALADLLPEMKVCVHACLLAMPLILS